MQGNVDANDSVYVSKVISSRRTPIGPLLAWSRASISLRVALALLILLLASSTFAASATWNLNPITLLWDTVTNWTPTTFPNGPEDTATFGISNITEVDLLRNIEVNSIVFNATASAFTITSVSGGEFSNVLTLSGIGVTNNSGIIQNFVAEAVTELG